MLGSTVWTTQRNFKANADLQFNETGISVVHKPGKVVAELRRRNVYAMTSGDRGKTHTVLSCVSASGYIQHPSSVLTFTHHSYIAASGCGGV